MRNFREMHPTRNCNETFNDYKKYKLFLQANFNHRCGYTDCRDNWFGGKNTFHIDHFKPKKKYPELETAYSNLVYSCSYVNILKKDDDSAFYLDPCENNYNEHFEREDDGRIIPKPESLSAKYMYRKLKLYLMRYQIIWLLDQIEDRIKKIKRQVDEEKNADRALHMYKLIAELADEYFNYRDYLNSEL
jgi:hypothetical protein